MNRIKELREEKGMTQLRLSVELGVTQETISAYENGKHFSSVEVLIKMSRLFNASCDYILGLSDIRNILKIDDLTQEELGLVEDFRKLLPSEHSLLKGYIKGLIDSRSRQTTSPQKYYN